MHAASTETGTRGCQPIDGEAPKPTDTYSNPGTEHDTRLRAANAAGWAEIIAT